MIGDKSFSIHPRKGEYILLDKECGNLIKSTIFRTPTKMGKGILTTPTVDGNLLLGPTSEDIEDRDNKETTDEGIKKVIEGAEKNIKSVPSSKVITSFTGLRAVGNTGDFIINIKDNFINVAGIESPGLSASPAIAEYVVNLIRETGFNLDKKENYIEKRKAYHEFKTLSQEEKNKIIKEKPEYGKIICRCEEVTLRRNSICNKSKSKSKGYRWNKKKNQSNYGKMSRWILYAKFNRNTCKRIKHSI